MERTLSENPNEPYDESELFRMAEKTAQRYRIPSRWRDDAVAEYVCAAYVAGKAPGAHVNIHAYQHKSGLGAVSNFLRRERRQEALGPKNSLKGATRVSLSLSVSDQDGEDIGLADTLLDPKTPAPDAGLRRNERDAAVAGGMAWLYPGQREILQRVCLNGESERHAASVLKITRHELREAMSNARAFLREYLAEFKDDFTGVRYSRG